MDAWLPKPDRWATPGGPRTRLLAAPAPPEPLPFHTDIVGTNRNDAGWYVEGARQFMIEAAQALRARERPIRAGRSKPLLAMPLVGSGGGGGEMISGELARGLLHMLREQCALLDVDAALVLIDGPAWAAAQHERLVDAAGSWPELSRELADVADDLATRANSGDLVLFLGAGVSQGAGLPNWNALLADVAAERIALNDAERDALSRLGELDRAAVIKRRLQDGTALGDAVATHLRARSTRYATAHALLASLPVDEVITTNYDTLFEAASRACERPCTVLPGGEVWRGRRWLLKMHGCVTRPDTIVLTREDYLKFQENRTALAGIVQALLLTRHMLFIGFSLTDDNFHRIAHAVRSAMHSDARFGTSLVVGGNPLAEELWGKELEWVQFGNAPRTLEIFLDRLSAKAAVATSHLGDRRYEAVLSSAERALRDRLEVLAEAVPPEERATGAWAEVERALRRLGIKPGRSRGRSAP